MKIKCKGYFFYLSHVGLSELSQTSRSLIVQSLTISAQSRQSVWQKHHKQNTCLTAMFGHYIGGYFLKIYTAAISDRFCCLASITTGILETSVLCMRCLVKHQVGTFFKRHTLVPSPTPPQHSVAWTKRGRGNSLNAMSANFSARRLQADGIQAWRLPPVYCTNNSPCNWSRVSQYMLEIGHNNGKCMQF